MIEDGHYKPRFKQVRKAPTRSVSREGIARGIDRAHESMARRRIERWLQISRGSSNEEPQE